MSDFVQVAAASPSIPRLDSQELPAAPAGRSQATQPDRRRLVEDNLDVSRFEAVLVYARCRQHIELDELIALGNLGLAEAASRFDASFGVPFRTFARYRVRGSIIDGIRRTTTLPRAVWKRLVRLQAASEQLEHRGLEAARSGPSGSTNDTAAILAAVKEAISSIGTLYLVPFDDSDPSLADPTEDPDARIDTAALAESVRHAVELLPDRERRMVDEHYWGDRTLKDIGIELGRSKSWACKLHASAIDRLRTLYGEPGNLPPARRLRREGSNTRAQRRAA